MPALVSLNHKYFFQSFIHIIFIVFDILFASPVFRRLPPPLGPGGGGGSDGRFRRQVLRESTFGFFQRSLPRECGKLHYLFPLGMRFCFPSPSPAMVIRYVTCSSGEKGGKAFLMHVHSMPAAYVTAQECFFLSVKAARRNNNAKRERGEKKPPTYILNIFLA